MTLSQHCALFCKALFLSVYGCPAWVIFFLNKNLDCLKFYVPDINGRTNIHRNAVCEIHRNAEKNKRLRHKIKILFQQINIDQNTLNCDDGSITCVVLSSGSISNTANSESWFLNFRLHQAKWGGLSKPEVDIK